MSPSLDPLIAERLRDFAQRWTRLVWVRGLCAAAATLLVAFTAVAWLDRFLVLTEGTRWLLSLVGYAATALAFWFVAGRMLAKPPSARELAALMEKAWPGLRSQLVAAVELAEKSADGKTDSFAFRDLVQEGVARRVRDLRMEDVLPRAHIAAWTRSALLCFTVVAGMFVVPSLEFPRQLARAFVPMADIERVARTKIRVVEPAADTRWLAQGDHQAIVIELAGADTDRAELEVLEANGKAERVVMSPGSGSQFTATVPVGQGAFAFRVRAGDALTKTVTIATRARPVVVAFEKTYEAPAYAQLPSRRVEEENGNVAALEGSVADLRMRVNQSVRAGELAIVADGTTNLVALTAPEANIVHARIAVRGSATYQVRLVAAETGFGNKFSPTFEIRAEPDLAPRVALEQPRTNLVVAPDEVVSVRGTAGDDIGLAAVAQQFQVNAGPWVEVPLALANKTNSLVTNRWDLLLLGLAPGDRVVTKLVARDLRGTLAESGAVTLTVGAARMDTKRSETLAARQAVQETLESASRVAAELRSVYSPELMAKIRAGDEVQRQQTVAGADTTLAGVEARLERAARQLDTATPPDDSTRAAVDVALLKKAVAAAQQEILPAAQAERERLGKAPADEVTSAASAAAKSGQRLVDFTAQLAAQSKELAAAEQAAAASERLEQMAREQRQQAEAAAQAVAESRRPSPDAAKEAARQQAATGGAAAQAERELGELKPQVPKAAGERLAKAQEQLKAVREAAERAGSSGQSGQSDKAGQPDKAGAAGKSAGAGESAETAAGRAAEQMKRNVEQAANTTRGVSREQSQRAEKARGELARMTEGEGDKLTKLRRDLDRLAQMERQRSEGRAPGGDTAALGAQMDALAHSLVQRLSPDSQPGKGQAGKGQSTGSAGNAGQGSGPGGGATRAGGSGTAGALPELGELKNADWAKLPPKLAQDLREAQQNGVSGDYRVMVDAYFKAVAERARK